MEIGSFDYDNLCAGGFPQVTQGKTIAQNQTLARGAVLGIITASGQAVAVDSTATDGSQNPAFILAEAVTTGSGVTAEAPVYETGEFNENALTFGGSDTADDHRAKLRELGIHLKSNQSAVN